MNSNFEMFRYHVQLFGTRADLQDTEFEFSINFGEELQLFGSSLSTSPVEKLTGVVSPTHRASCDKLAEKTMAFYETDMPLNQVFKIQLTNLDTVKSFGIILRSQLEKRDAFLAKFHQWHRDNRKSIAQSHAMFDKNGVAGGKSVKSFVGMPCALSSVQVGKWCRGLVLNVDFAGQLANIYLVDYGEKYTMDLLFTPFISACSTLTL